MVIGASVSVGEDSDAASVLVELQTDTRAVSMLAASAACCAVYMALGEHR